MAISNIAITFDNTNDTTFRSWGSALSAAIQGIGPIKMGDTGQINWTTVAKPSAASTSAGYEMYQLSEWSDNFNVANAQVATSSSGATYLALSGGTGLPYVVSNQLTAAAAPVNTANAAGLFNVGSTVQIVDFDTPTSLAYQDGIVYWDLWLRYTSDTDALRVQFTKNGGTWTVSVTRYGTGTTTLGTSGSLGTTDPTHLKAEIDAFGKITASFITTTTQTFTVTDNSRTGTRAGVGLWGASTADNLCVANAYPLYMKIEYGTGGSGAGTPGIYTTFSNRTDGAGAMTGTVTTSRKILYGSNITANTLPVYLCGIGSYFFLTINAIRIVTNFSDFGLLLLVDRTRNSDGTVNYDAYVAMSTASQAVTGNLSLGTTWGSAGTGGQSWLTTWVGSYAISQVATVGDPVGTGSNYTASQQFQVPWGFTTAAYGGDTYYFPWNITAPRRQYMLAQVAAFTADLGAELSTVSLPVLGSSHTYLITPFDFTGLGRANVKNLVRYE